MANPKSGPWSLEDVRRAMGSTKPKSPFDDPEREAAARLSAGAAELLQTSKGVVRILDAVRYQVGLGPSQIARLEAARTAIAKMEGRP
ncbi:hypothetical protein ATER59S_00352 [Aquamicrobium terrae]